MNWKITILILLLSSVACSKSISSTEDSCPKPQTNLSKILVPKNRLLLFADISAINPQLQTKSISTIEEYYSLASLLDESKIKTLQNEVFYITQIPFRADIAEGLAYYGDNPLASIEESTFTK